MARGLTIRYIACLSRLTRRLRLGNSLRGVKDRDIGGRAGRVFLFVDNLGCEEVKKLGFLYHQSKGVLEKVGK
jgi:hypothetical protein